MGAPEVQGRGLVKGRRRLRRSLRLEAAGGGGKGLSLPRKKISLKYGKSCWQSRAAQRLAGSPFKLPSVGDFELKVGIGCELLSCSFTVFLFRQWGHWMDWSLAFTLFVSLLVTYASLLLLLAVLLWFCGQPLHLHSVHKVLLLLIVLLVLAGLVVLDVQWQEEWLSLRLSLWATAPFLHIGAVAFITILAWPVADNFYHIHKRAGPPLLTGHKIVLLFVYFTIVLAIYLAPLCISSTCIMEPRDLSPKPRLVGHRGAPMLAPENTLMSLRKTAECGANVFETDVMISSDGIPFLMHDEHLSRTTDVASVFPTRITAHSSDFSWAELKRLNAGAWFLERPPFWEATQLSGLDRKEAENQTVPTLEELLKEAAVLNLSIMFDLRRPPRNHTYYDTYVNLTLETVLNSRVPQAMVLWLPDEDRANVQQRAPRMHQIYGQLGVNRTERPLFLNLPYQDLPQLDIKALHEDNVSVNLFVVNKPWLFSILWCAGVDSVTTNDCQLLQQIPYPVWLMGPGDGTDSDSYCLELGVGLFGSFEILRPFLGHQIGLNLGKAVWGNPGSKGHA
ncbi:glycerophosphoinositol inositolphosphodiesterase GDPD2 isoform X2 [Myotis myotis]|uniref:glycerophosphoinositol inositolphosphodiesterase GDPD2 isoform X2 n=1 Tax=Myotis myotis TaxID=51298 RepID=UPI001748F9E2|nr:glycerophosphoinositol inositolphosphodiesterase GDPD2 isoform X2 [Myotis myotis]